MPIILALVNHFPYLSYGLQAIHYLSSTLGDVVISFLYNYTLDASWQVFIGNIQESLSTAVCSLRRSLAAGMQLDNKDLAENQEDEGPLITKICLIGRSKGQKIVLGEPDITEKLTLNFFSPSKDLYYKQIEEGFSNPNTDMNMKVLDWLCESISMLRNKDDGEQSPALDLLEMYCGNGNHTVALSSKFAVLFF
jgi:tRNA (uracil-5-)-methyltransferase